MADAYWRYTDARQPQPQSMTAVVGKRPRSDYDVSSSHELPNYYPRDDDRGAFRGTRDSDSIGASYDRYLRNTQISSYAMGQSVQSITGVPGRSVDDPRIVAIASMDSGDTVKDRILAGGGGPEVSLPPDATGTLFVEGLPPDCTRREVARILSSVSAFMVDAFYFLGSFLDLVNRYLSPICWLQGSKACKQGVKTSWGRSTDSLFC
uniref:RNA-binding protein 2 isoform X1 n=1 Tax=Rhizophora mucronata TaxID=61149 RepID=A0A2P2KDN5_RHIMU